MGWQIHRVMTVPTRGVPVIVGFHSADVSVASLVGARKLFFVMGVREDATSRGRNTPTGSCHFISDGGGGDAGYQNCLIAIVLVYYVLRDHHRAASFVTMSSQRK
jgi:hypothetical protein